MIRLCFVCLGNICRSPTAEGIFQSLVQQRGLDKHYQIDSAGTGGWHVGAAPDPRSAQEAKARGVELHSQARQFQSPDFEAFDQVIAMDRNNQRDLVALCPRPELACKVQLLRDFDPQNTRGESLDVPDPYYGQERGFAEVFEICQRSCGALLDALEQKRQAPSA